jgi:hypothetical protein
MAAAERGDLLLKLDRGVVRSFPLPATQT